MKSKTTKLWIAGGIMAAAFMTAATLQTDYITADAKAKKQETNSTVTYKVKGSTLTIKGSGSMSASMKFGSKKKTKKIKKVVVKKGVTTISANAFKDCKKLTSVSLPSGLLKIGRGSFKGTAIKSITIPASVRLMGNQAFSGCTKLKTVTLSDGYQCFGYDKDEGPAQLATATLDNVIIRNPLKSLDDLTWLGFNTKNYTLAANDSNYKSIDGAVYNKDGSKLLYVPTKKTGLGLTADCKEVDLNAFSHYIGDDFYSRCKNMGTIVLPATVTKLTTSVCAGDEAGKGLHFDIQNKNLDEESMAALIDFVGIDTAKSWFPQDFREEGFFTICKSTYLYSVSNAGKKEKKLTLPEGIKTIRENSLAYLAAEEVVLPEGLETIGNRAFEGSRELKKVNFPDSVKSIGSRAFYDTKMGDCIPARFASGKDKIYKETGTIESNIDNNQLILDGDEHTYDFEGTNTRIFRFSVTERCTVEVRNSLSYTTLKEAKFQKKVDDNWVNLEVIGSGNDVYRDLTCTVEPGEYRVVYEANSKAGVINLTATVYTRACYVPEKYGTKKSKAVELGERESEVDTSETPQYYRQGYMTYSDANTKWFKFTKKKKTSGKFKIINQNVGYKGKMTISIYKKGKKKAVKTIKCKSIDRKVNSLKVKGKGTYYVKIYRTSKSTVGEYTIGFNYGKK